MGDEQPFYCAVILVPTLHTAITHVIVVLEWWSLMWITMAHT